MKRCVTLFSRCVQPSTRFSGRARPAYCVSTHTPLQLRTPLFLGQQKTFFHGSPQRWAQDSGKDSGSDAEGAKASSAGETADPAAEQGTEDHQEASGDGAEEKVELSIEEQLAQANERIASMESEVAAKQDQLLRTLADMENTRRISKRDIDQAREYANRSFAKGLLDVADNMQRALLSVEGESVDDSPILKTLVEGVEMTDKELKKVFAKNGVSQFGEVGEKFDPHMHNALFQYPDPSLEAGTIGQVIKTGFKLKDRVLRPADVGTIKK